MGNSTDHRRSGGWSARRRPWYAAGGALVLLTLAVGLLVLPRGGRTAPFRAGGWTTSVAAPAETAPGSTVGLRADVTADTGRQALVDVEVYSATSKKVFQQHWDGSSFLPSQARGFQVDWAVQADLAPGDYTVVVGVFSPGWGEVWHWNDAAAVIRVGPTPTTPPPTTERPATTEPSPSTQSPPTTMPPGHGGHHVACPGERDTTPLGALPPALPVLCDDLGPAVDTARVGPGSWADEFDHGAAMSEMAPSYVQGHVGSGGTSRHFLHKDHWMVDLRSDSGQYPTLMAAWMRPDRAFAPRADGSVVIEFEVATPVAGTRDVAAVADSWPEFAISTAPAPTGMNPWGSPFLRNGTYFYEAFAAADVMGCRIQQSRHPICAFYGAGSEGAGGPDRLWEVNQNGTDVVPGSEFGGDPSVAGLADAWAVCSSTDDPDTVCRNTFRVTLMAERIRIDVKPPGGEFVRYYEAVPCNERAGCATGQMGRILGAPDGFYVYFADFAYRIEDGEVIRFHWDHLAVNP